MGPQAGETPADLRPAERLGAPIIHIQLDRELELLRASDSYRTADHAAATILKRPGIRVVLVALRAGGQMHAHHADSPITVQSPAGAYSIRRRWSDPRAAAGAPRRCGREPAPQSSRRGGECLPTHHRAGSDSPE